MAEVSYTMLRVYAASKGHYSVSTLSVRGQQGSVRSQQRSILNYYSIITVSKIIVGRMAKTETPWSSEKHLVSFPATPTSP
jgi:hypothetical protein